MSAVTVPHETVRVRHELRRRAVTVVGVERLTPRTRRVRFASPDLADFRSLSPDDHVKLFFPRAGDPPARPVMRDYTPRAFDAEAATLTIDFALHEGGPATEWAERAAVGDVLEIGGPRGSRVVPDDFDWYLLVGDESALPAIGRRVEGLRAGVPVTTVAVVADERERQVFDTSAAWLPVWLERGEPSARDAGLVARALEGLVPPPGDGFVWIAGEASLARAARDVALGALGHPKEWLRATGYWKRGATDAHVDLDD